jgi:hypothetical protein
MALERLQVAFREVIRSAGLAQEGAARKRDQEMRRARLKPSQSAALSRIPLERLAVYHDLVVGGHRSMVSHIYGATLAVLAIAKKSRPGLGVDQSVRELAEGFIGKDLARTHSLRELADRFGRFLRTADRRAFRAVPLLEELARFERAKLDVDLVEDGPGEPATQARLEKLAASTIGRLFETCLVVPTHLRALRVRHDVVHALATLAENRPDVDLAELTRPADQVIVVTRHPASLLPVHAGYAPEVWRDLRRFTPGTPFSIEDLARVRRFRGPRGETEEAALGRVVAEVFEWLRGGILLFAGKNASTRKTAARRKSTEAGQRSAIKRSRASRARPRSGR